jgi:hypothetical protein
LELVRYVPPWFPGTSFQQYAKHMRKTLEDMAQLPFNYTKKQRVHLLFHSSHTLAYFSHIQANGTASISFVSTLLETNPEEEDIIMWSATSMYVGM